MKKIIFALVVLLFTVILEPVTVYALGGGANYKKSYYDVYTYRIGEKTSTYDSKKRYNNLNKQFKNWLEEKYTPEEMANLHVTLREKSAEEMRLYPSREILNVNGRPWQLVPEYAKYIQKKVMDDYYKIGLPKDMEILPKLPTEGNTRIYIYLDRFIGSKLTANSAEFINLDVKPYLDGNVTMIPLRGIVDNLGAEISWNPEIQEVRVKANGKEVLLTQNSQTALVNGEIVELSKPMSIKKGRTFIPVRFVSEKLGYEVGWLGGFTAKFKTLDHNNNKAEIKERPYFFNRISITNNGINNNKQVPPVPVGKVDKPINIQSLLLKIKPSTVFAQINNDVNMFSDYSSTKRKVGTVSKGEKVEVLRDRSYKWYQVKSLKDGKVGWVYKDALRIPQDPKTTIIRLTKEELQSFVNYKKFSSKTNNLVWVDIDRQLTYVFEGQKGDWQLIKTMLAATGRNVSPTIRGLFQVNGRGNWFYSERLGSGARNWVRFNGAYLFHSVSMNKNKEVIDPLLGVRRSSGCIRLSVKNSQWIYDNINDGTTVYVN